MKAKQRLSWQKINRPDQRPAPEALRNGPLAVAPAVRDIETLQQREAEPFRPVLPPPGAAPARPAKPGEGQEPPAIVRFARRHSDRLNANNQQLTAKKLVKAFDKIANAFRQDGLFQGHVRFPELYRTALLELSRYDLQVNLGAAARGRMADRSLAAFWRSYFSVNPTADSTDYFATVETAAVLALFSNDAELFTDDGDGPVWPAEDQK